MPLESHKFSVKRKVLDIPEAEDIYKNQQYVEEISEDGEVPIELIQQPIYDRIRKTITPIKKLRKKNDVKASPKPKTITPTIPNQLHRIEELKNDVARLRKKINQFIPDSKVKKPPVIIKVKGKHPVKVNRKSTKMKKQIILKSFGKRSPRSKAGKKKKIVKVKKRGKQSTKKTANKGNLKKVMEKVKSDHKAEIFKEVAQTLIAGITKQIS